MDEGMILSEIISSLTFPDIVWRSGLKVGDIAATTILRQCQ